MRSIDHLVIHTVPLILLYNVRGQFAYAALWESKGCFSYAWCHKCKITPPPLLFVIRFWCALHSLLWRGSACSYVWALQILFSWVAKIHWHQTFELQRYREHRCISFGLYLSSVFSEDCCCLLLITCKLQLSECKYFRLQVSLGRARYSLPWCSPLGTWICWQPSFLYTTVAWR